MATTSSIGGIAGGGPASADNRPGLSSDDGRVWTGGLLLRCRPDGSGLTVLSHNYRNEYEVARDAFGNLYTECYVNMNGNITFGAGDSDFTENASDSLCATFEHDEIPSPFGTNPSDVPHSVWWSWTPPARPSTSWPPPTRVDAVSVG